MLPLLMESDYVPDGWLGAMVGMKLYVDLSHPGYEKKFPEIERKVKTIISSTRESDSDAISPGKSKHNYYRDYPVLTIFSQ